MPDDVFVYIREDIPASVGELVSPCPDGCTVLISAHLDDAHRQEAYEHALKHIQNGDFDIDNVKTVEEIEAIAHGLEPDSIIPLHRLQEEIRLLHLKREKIQKAIARKEKQIKRLVKRHYDFYSAAERAWLEPKE